MRAPRRAAGFTIVELMLFLAITGLLFLIGFWGTSFQVRNVRFTDGIRDLDSYLQGQYNLVSTGANPRALNATCINNGTSLSFATTNTPPATAGTQDQCVLLGKVIKFNPGSGDVNTYYVAGRRLTDTSSPQLSGNDMTDLQNSLPTVSDQATETYNINWGLTFFQSSVAAPNNLTQVFAFLRSPSSGKIMSFALPSSSAGNSLGSGTPLTSTLINSGNLANNAGYCFKDAGNRKAIIRLGQGNRSDALDLTFDNVASDSDCTRSGS